MRAGVVESMFLDAFFLGGEYCGELCCLCLSLLRGIWEFGREIGIPDPIVEPVAWVEVAVGAGDGVAVGVLGSVVYFSLDLRCMNWMLEEM